MRLLALALAFILPATGQQEQGDIRHLTFGGAAGLSWGDGAVLNALMGETASPGALQPLELRPDVNFVPELFDRYPFERRVNTANPLWLDGMPRLWRGFGVIGNRASSLPASPLYVDGDRTTLVSVTNYLNNYSTSEFYTFDLGGRLPLERFVLTLPPAHLVDNFGEPWENYVPVHGELSGSEFGEQLHDEFTDASKSTTEFSTFRSGVTYPPLDQVLGAVQENLEAPIDIAFATQRLRYVRWRTFPDAAGQRVANAKLAYAEFELFGNGFAAESRLQTAAVDLGEAVLIGGVELGVSGWRRDGAGWTEDGDGSRRWETGALVQIDPGEAEAVVRVRLKTGSTPDPRQFFTYGDAGDLQEVDSATWESLRLRETREQPRYIGWRGPVVTDLDNWPPWSGQISETGTRPDLSVGRYLQVLVQAATKDPRRMVRLDSLRIELLPLLATELVGEVALVGDTGESLLAQVPLAEPVELVYAIRAGFAAAAAAAGFDAIHISTPSSAEFISLRLGAPPVTVEPDLVEQGADGLTLFLPAAIAADETLQIELRTRLYAVSRLLEGEVFNRRDAHVRQRVEAGNALDAIATDRLLLVAADEPDEAIAELSIESRIITPNGDGVNDEARIGFALFGVLAADVGVCFYDLAGRPVRRIELSGLPSGVGRRAVWDGRDNSGSPVLPGLYLCLVETETARGRSAAAQTVAVSY